MRSRSTVPRLANPVLVGAVTLAVTFVAVFLSYNANSGLPFVPTYGFKAEVPDAAELREGNEVLVGGSRVGIVQTIDAVERGGRTFAVLDMKVEEDVGPLPTDTRLLIRQRSNVGLKYVELRPGRARTTLRQGGTLPLHQAVLAESLDDALDTFDAPTRTAIQGLLRDLGGGFAGRGENLNQALEALPGALADLETVARVLRSSDADLAGFVRGAASAAATVAPVAEQLADLVDDGATTFAALAREDAALAASIDAFAQTERTGTPALWHAEPLLAQAAALAREARPGIRLLPTAGARVARALDRAGPPLRRARTLAAPLSATVREVRALSRARGTTGALQRLTETLRYLAPALTYINPLQTQCNYLGLWTRNVPSVVSEGNASGTWFRFVPIVKLDEWLPSATQTSDLHYVTQGDAGQSGECEAGNENWSPGKQVGPVPGTQPNHTEQTRPGTLAERVAAEEPAR